ncbi:hypothetical protein SAMN05421755_11041 [Nitrosomonas sp. Nm33]|nr:hypothetical protein SAMN05421755_11041 [Nitrosomonas sp. Nm33]
MKVWLPWHAGICGYLCEMSTDPKKLFHLNSKAIRSIMATLSSDQKRIRFFKAFLSFNRISKLKISAQP